MTTNIYYTIESFRSALISALSERMTDRTMEKMDVVKANDIALHGISAKKGETAPTIYVEDYHRQHLDGRDLESIADEIEDIIRNADDAPIGAITKRSFDFDSIREQLTVRLLDAEKNRKYLKNRPYREIGAGLVLTADISFENGFLIAVTNEMAESFDIGEMFDTALRNTMEKHRAKLTEMEAAIFGTAENLLTNGTQHIDGMYVLTGEDCEAFGASVLAYPMIAKTVRELYGMDFYILPSSQHEVLTVPDNGDFNADDLAEMVRQANATIVEPHDILSDGVYFYSKNGLCRVA